MSRGIKLDRIFFIIKIKLTVTHVCIEVGLNSANGFCTKIRLAFSLNPMYFTMLHYLSEYDKSCLFLRQSRWLSNYDYFNAVCLPSISYVYSERYTVSGMA